MGPGRLKAVITECTGACIHTYVLAVYSLTVSFRPSYWLCKVVTVLPQGKDEETEARRGRRHAQSLMAGEWWRWVVAHSCVSETLRLSSGGRTALHLA